jgi:hypothetical protein
MIRRNPSAARAPAWEIWLYRNPVALRRVREGLAQAAKGKLRSLASFAKYADEETASGNRC